MQRPALLSSRPDCPLHPQAKVWRDGFGGRVHLRQRFKRVQADGTKHVFSEPIPRQVARDVECDECERDLARHEGPRSPKDYFFTISQAASVLTRVGIGDSYRAAAQSARRLDHRLARKKPKYRDYSLSGHLAENWVEVFAPVLRGLGDGGEPRHRPSGGRELAAEGVRVSICARGREDLEKAAQAIHDRGGEVLTVQADASKTEAPAHVVDETVRRFGKVDILVNNAGDAWLGRSVDTSEDDWRYSMDVTFFSAVRFTRAVVPHMRRQGGGRIVNIASVSGHTMLGGLADYQSAKAAMLAFSKTMAIDLAADNILVNCVCPALIHTPLWDRLADAMVPAVGKTREEVF